MTRPLDILHCHSTFSLGGKEARAVALMNAFGDRARHTILSSVPGALGAREAIDDSIAVDFPDDAPSLQGWPGLLRYRELVRYMARFDLVLTYNWGAMDAVLARRLLPHGCPPLVHHEDGFNADETERLKPKRNWLRRLGLPAAHAVVVPSQRLERIATTAWRQPPVQVRRIPNGIRVSDYGGTAEALPGLERQAGEIIVGTLAGMRGVKNLSRLVRAALVLPNVRLCIVGEGPERDAIIATAAAMGGRGRLVLTGFVPEPHRYIGAFDIFALSSDSEQFPISLVEAMAAGLPVVATDVGDVRAMLPEAQRRFVVARDDSALRMALEELVARPDLRRRLGDQNRLHAVRHYDERSMIAAYASLYDQAVGDGVARLSQPAL